MMNFTGVDLKGNNAITMEWNCLSGYLSRYDGIKSSAFDSKCMVITFGEIKIRRGRCRLSLSSSYAPQREGGESPYQSIVHGNITECWAFGQTLRACLSRPSELPPDQAVFGS
jgi:hypothetical protein